MQTPAGKNESEVTIVQLIDHPEFESTVIDWTLREWPKGDRASTEDRLFGSRDRDKLPFVLVALHRNIPVGFVSVILYENGIEEDRPHWINALYVIPSKRRKGLALELIQAAEKMARALTISQLFVLTDVPEVYKKIGWSKKETSTENSEEVILFKALL